MVFILYYFYCFTSIYSQKPEHDDVIAVYLAALHFVTGEAISTQFISIIMNPFSKPAPFPK